MFFLALLVWTWSGDCWACVVDSPSGQIQGFEKTSRDGRGYFAWTRIPYAKPPVGQLRLAAPEPYGKWDGILNATIHAPKCPQLPGPTGQEDCLYLNVFKPKDETSKQLPVLVYIHGGAFKVGDSGSPNAPDYIMDEDVVLVSVAYRLGALGFMSMKQVEFPGNYGLKDQALALKWVKENIAAFGGDPNSITVFGISAGGASVHELLLSPLTKDIVTRAVPISGLASKVWGMKNDEQIVENTLAAANLIGCQGKTPLNVLECLRGKDVACFLKEPPKKNPLQLVHFFPTTEPEGPGAFAPYDLTAVESTKPIIIGYSVGEHLLIEIPGMWLGLGKVIADNVVGTVEGFLSACCDIRKERLAEQVENVKKEYFNGSTPDELLHGASKMLADASFVYQALTAGKYHKGPKWIYRMDYRGELSLFDGVAKTNFSIPCHGDDAFLLLNVREAIKTAKPQEGPEDIRVSKELIKYVVNFAYHGNPAPEGSGLVWKPFEGKEILRIMSSKSAMADDAIVQEELNIRQRWADIFGTNTWYK